MAGVENLNPVRSVDEAREKGRKGGIASGQSRRRKKTMADALDTIMSMQVKDDIAIAKVKSLFPEITEEEIDYQLLAVASILNKAIKDGSPQKMEFIRDTIGEKPVDKVEVVQPVSETIDKIEAYLAEREASNDGTEGEKVSGSDN